MQTSTTLSSALTQMCWTFWGLFFTDHLNITRHLWKINWRIIRDFNCWVSLLNWEDVLRFYKTCVNYWHSPMVLDAKRNKKNTCKLNSRRENHLRKVTSMFLMRERHQYFGGKFKSLRTFSSGSSSSSRFQMDPYEMKHHLMCHLSNSYLTDIYF